MKYIQNLHTHSVYCDGKDTPEEMIAAAKAKGFESIGFSGHSYMDYSDYMRGKDRTAEYIKDVTALKAKYKGDFEIFLGLEVDMYSEIDPSVYDYLIGSVHLISIENELVEVDHTARKIIEASDKYFCGDRMLFAKRYYETVIELAEKFKFDIVGHIDLVTKFNEKDCVIDTSDRRYMTYVTDAVDALIPTGAIFEINTGAIARGMRTTPYPSDDLLKFMIHNNAKLILNSDCHSRQKLDCYFTETKQYLRSLGCWELYILYDGAFQTEAL